MFKWGKQLIGKTGAHLIAVLASTCFIGQAAVAAGDQPLTFTGPQAAHGQTPFESNCTNCHGLSLEGGAGGPPLSGEAFRARWLPQTGDALYTFVRTKMPPGNPGSLTPADYADVMAYILKGNGVTASATPFSSDPKALAPLSLAEALGVKAPQGAGMVGLPDISSMIPPGRPDPIALAELKRKADRMAALPSVTEEMLKNPPQGSWLHWRGDYDAQGFSKLKQIDRANVGRLTTAWSWELYAGQNEITPLVYDGILFVFSAGHVEALDAATGDRMWEYARPVSGGLQRAMAVYGDKIFLESGVDIVALNIHTGAVVWDHPVLLEGAKAYFSGGPIVAKGKVMGGVTCDHLWPGGCFIVALDADTGKEAWRFNTIARPGEPGGDSWNGNPVDARHGGNVWMPGSYAPDLDLVYFGVAQTYKVAALLDGATEKPGSNDGLYTDSTVALRPETGELVWYYQHTNREVWDLDWAFERTLATIKIDGKPRLTVTTAGKLSIFDTLDAATGKYLFSHDMGVQNLISAIDPKTGAKTVVPDMEPKANVEQIVCPSNVGGRDWPATAYNPETGIVYVPLAETCSSYRYKPGADSMSLGIAVLPKGSDGMVGRLQAFDLVSGKTIWTKRQRAPQSSAILATAGGLVFEGTRDRWFRALDDRTGEVLWQVRLNEMASSFPITYSVGGVQYVAVTTGGGNPVDILTGRLAPEIATPSSATTLWVFRLPEKK